LKLLALDCSSAAASAAIFDNETLAAQYYINIRQTHSQTLLPMTNDMLSAVGCSLKDLDMLAVSVGPGSFTGLRIGISAVKGMAFGLNIPCLGVSTLESLAWNACNCQGIIAAVLDARCSQVYTAVFESDGKVPSRLTPDMAVSIDELGEMLLKYKKTVFLVGDGALLCYNNLVKKVPSMIPVSAALMFQNAASVGMAALAHRDDAGDPSKLAPVYLRLPQAERERQRRQGIDV